MSSRIFSIYQKYAIGTGAICLGATGVAKIVSILSTAAILRQRDPLLLIPNRYLFALLGCCEVVGAILMVYSAKNGLRYFIPLGFGASFVLYRITYNAAGIKGWCPCLGVVGDNLLLPLSLQQLLLQMIACYLLAIGIVGVMSIFCAPGTHKRSTVPI